MLTTSTLLVILVAIGLYSLFSRKIEASILTLPMLFAGLGLAIGQSGLSLVPMEIGNRVIHTIAEITLILVLFADASRVNWKSLFSFSAIPVRMLLVGMPLTVLFGTGVAHWVTPDASWALAFLTAAILTPTDAALGQSVVTSPDVPKHLGQSINVESGLNDGLALPVVLVAAIFVSGGMTVTAGHGPENIPLFAAKQVLLGPLAGLVIGFGCARLLDYATARNLATEVARGLYFLAVAFFAYFGAEAIGGNGFISAFIAGLVFGNMLDSPSTFIHEFMEGEGQLFTLLTFLIFGAVLAPIGLEHATFRTTVLAILFLTAVRMLPIWLSLLGTGMRLSDKLFLGWFGHAASPRSCSHYSFSNSMNSRAQTRWSPAWC